MTDIGHHLFYNYADHAWLFIGYYISNTINDWLWWNPYISFLNGVV